MCSQLPSYVEHSKWWVYGIVQFLSELLTQHWYSTQQYNCSESMAKASSRGTFPLLDRGVDLAYAMKRGCASVGGEGGGHRIAAGGSFDSVRRDDFLKKVDKIVGEQMSKH